MLFPRPLSFNNVNCFYVDFRDRDKLVNLSLNSYEVVSDICDSSSDADSCLIDISPFEFNLDVSPDYCAVYFNQELAGIELV
jgi:hypothetical protein